MTLRWAMLLGLAIAIPACGDDDHGDLGGPGDLSAADLPVVLPDLTGCPPAQFTGFPGDSPTERRLDCTLCGCQIDTLTNAASQGLWSKTTAGATLTDSGAGIVMLTDGISGPAFATLASLNVAGPFYIDGDFDLRVDFLISLINPATHVSLRVATIDGTFYEVARTRSSVGEDAYTAQLDGSSVAVATGVTEGTLRLTRVGATITGFGDNNQVNTFLGGSPARVAIFLSAGIDGCFAADGGSCTLQTTLHDVRLVSGALVDRR